MTPAPIDMTGARIGNLQVIEYAPDSPRRAHWWVLCLACQHQQIERGGDLRKSQRREDYRIICKGCGA